MRLALSGYIRWPMPMSQKKNKNIYSRNASHSSDFFHIFCWETNKIMNKWRTRRTERTRDHQLMHSNCIHTNDRGWILNWPILLCCVSMCVCARAWVRVHRQFGRPAAVQHISPPLYITISLLNASAAAIAARLLRLNPKTIAGRNCKLATAFAAVLHITKCRYFFGNKNSCSHNENYAVLLVWRLLLWQKGRQWFRGPDEHKYHQHSIPFSVVRERWRHIREKDTRQIASCALFSALFRCSNRCGCFVCLSLTICPFLHLKQSTRM